MDITITLGFPTPTISGDGLSNFLDDLSGYVYEGMVIIPGYMSLTIKAELDTDNYTLEEAQDDIEQLAHIRLKGCRVTFQ